MADTTTTPASTPTPLSAAEQQTLESLQARQAAITAAQTLATQQALLAALTQVGAALGTSASWQTMVDALQAAKPNLDAEMAARVERICIFANNDAQAIFAKINALGG